MFERCHRRFQKINRIARTINQRKSAVNQITWRRSWRFVARQIDDCLNANIEDHSPITSVANMAEPYRKRRDLTHRIFSSVQIGSWVGGVNQPVGRPNTGPDRWLNRDTKLLGDDPPDFQGDLLISPWTAPLKEATNGISANSFLGLSRYANLSALFLNSGGIMTSPVSRLQPLPVLSVEDYEKYRGQWVAVSRRDGQVYGFGDDEIADDENTQNQGHTRAEYFLEPIPTEDTLLW